MTRNLGLAALAIAGLGVGCSSGNNNPPPDAGHQMTVTDAGNNNGTDAGNQNPTISVGGTAYVHPVALALYDAGLLTGPVPQVDGQTLHIDEPLDVILMNPDGHQGSTIIADGGSYLVTGVDPTIVYVGLVATVLSATPDGGASDACEATSGTLPSFCSDFVPSATAVFEGNNPGDLSGKVAYADPVAMENFLSSKLSADAALQIAQGHHLIDQGYVLGYVVNNGQPVQGVSLDTNNNTMLQSNVVVYVDDDFNPIPAASTTGQVTNKYGIFLMVAPGSPTQYPNGFKILGQPSYGCHSVGSNPGSVFNLIFESSATPRSCT